METSIALMLILMVARPLCSCKQDLCRLHLIQFVNYSASDSLDKEMYFPKIEIFIPQYFKEIVVTLCIQSLSIVTLCTSFAMIVQSLAMPVNISSKILFSTLGLHSIHNPDFFIFDTDLHILCLQYT